MSVDALTVLVVDDDAVWRERLARALSDRGFSVATASDFDEALQRAADAPEYAVVDLRMPGRSGLDVLRALTDRDPNTKVLMLTGYGSIPTAVEATKAGAVGYLSKPADADEIVAALMGKPPSADVEVPTLARAEWEYIHRVLADCGENVSEAARRLGIHRRSLQRKLQKYPPSK